MNRPILYRGKVADNCPYYDDLLGQWITGGAVEKRQRPGTFIVGETTSMGHTREVIVDVDPKTVGQYVCDAVLSSGERIKVFEHDVLLLNKEELKLTKPMVVVYDEICSGFLFYPTDNTDDPIRDQNGYALVVNANIWASNGWIEYLGNIHDNPELVEWTDEQKKVVL